MDNPGFRDKSPSLPRQESKLALWIAAGRSGPEGAGATRVQWIAAAPRRSALLRVALQDQGAARDKSPNLKCGFVVSWVATFLVPSSADFVVSVTQIRAVPESQFGVGIGRH